MLQDANRAIEGERRGPTIHHTQRRRYNAPVNSMVSGTALNTAVTALFPWHDADYPGIIAGMVAVLRKRAAVLTIRDWRRGKRPAPIWAIETVRAELARRRAAIDHADALLAAELEKRKP